MFDDEAWSNYEMNKFNSLKASLGMDSDNGPSPLPDLGSVSDGSWDNQAEDASQLRWLGHNTAHYATPAKPRTPTEQRLSLLKMIYNWIQIHLELVLPHNGELIISPKRDPDDAVYLRERNFLMDLLSMSSGTTPRSVARHFAVPNTVGLVGDFLTDEWESVLPLRDGNDATTVPHPVANASAESDWDPA